MIALPKRYANNPFFFFVARAFVYNLELKYVLGYASSAPGIERVIEKIPSVPNLVPTVLIGFFCFILLNF